MSSVKDWTTFKKRIAGQTNANFLFNMSQKGHTGVIKFDHGIRIFAAPSMTIRS